MHQSALGRRDAQGVQLRSRRAGARKRSTAHAVWRTDTRRAARGSGARRFRRHNRRSAARPAEWAGSIRSGSPRYWPSPGRRSGRTSWNGHRDLFCRVLSSPTEDKQTSSPSV